MDLALSILDKLEEEDVGEVKASELLVELLSDERLLALASFNSIEVMSHLYLESSGSL